jgi:hypothetical protein
VFLAREDVFSINKGVLPIGKGQQVFTTQRHVFFAYEKTAKDEK